MNNLMWQPAKVQANENKNKKRNIQQNNTTSTTPSNKIHSANPKTKTKHIEIKPSCGES